MNSRRFSSLTIESPRGLRWLRPCVAVCVAGGLWATRLDPAVALLGSAAAVAAGWPPRKGALTTMRIVFDRETGAARGHCDGDTVGPLRQLAAGAGWVVLRLGNRDGGGRRRVIQRVFLGSGARRMLRLWALTLRHGP